MMKRVGLRLLAALTSKQTPFERSHPQLRRTMADFGKQQTAGGGPGAEKIKSAGGTTRFVRILEHFGNGKRMGDPGFYYEVAVIFTVFGVTGSSSMQAVRLLSDRIAGETGSISHGPNKWRASYLVLTLPMYTAFLLGFGTLSGRRTYFVNMLVKMYSGYLPKSMLAKLKNLAAHQAAPPPPQRK